MPVSEIRTQIYLQREQHEALKRAARARAVSMAQVVREAVASYLGLLAQEETAVKEEAYPADPAWKILEVAERIGGSGHRDGAANLEEELYGPIEA